ncbi:electron transfer flavoprotein subunit beta/FixA family protein [Chromohalobacter sp.]|uniref:electron transfer flavoprotein subunit beta/FixA family protein n=1 Tax=Chromohalobacter sp. TaxID=50740 RepID=UPI001E1431E5|nr:electron transfer flavoprotein subunit beta/FixA family protein [Chromohalobacter sp.]NQY46454.1 electron transfer flavoprotein subunit beta/FixA family protein [Chromohalobacter sp.]
MKILVGVKRVIDYNVKVKVRSDNTDVDLSNTKMAMNPFCEIAVEEAIRCKEKGIATEVVAVSIGPKGAQEQLRTALALGVDRAIHVQSEDLVDSLDVARVMASIVEEEKPELVILGKQAIDSDNNQTGQMLAALTGMGQGTFASELEVEDGKIRVTREVDGGHQVLSLRLPAVITTDLRLNEPRHARLPDIMKAKKKPINTRTLEELGVERTSYLTLMRVETPAQRQGGIKVDSVSELVNKLKDEAKVIS